MLYLVNYPFDCAEQRASRHAALREQPRPFQHLARVDAARRVQLDADGELAARQLLGNEWPA